MLKTGKFILISLVFVGSLALAQTRWNMHVAWPESNFHTQGVLNFADLVSGEVERGARDSRQTAAARWASRVRKSCAWCATAPCRSRRC